MYIIHKSKIWYKTSEIVSYFVLFVVLRDKKK